MSWFFLLSLAHIHDFLQLSLWDTTATCVRNLNWQSRFGLCAVYATSEFASYCDDWDKADRSTTARMACPQCNECVFVPGISESEPENPITSNCANYQCPSFTIVSYLREVGCTCRCISGRYGSDCSQQSPVWMNEFILVPNYCLKLFMHTSLNKKFGMFLLSEKRQSLESTEVSF